MTPQITVIPVAGHGTEDVLVDGDGSVFTGTEDGSIFRYDPVGSVVVRVGGTGGRPLGLEFLPDGRLLIADAHRGLLAMDPATGVPQTLVRDVAGRPMLFCNNAAVAADGGIWFSDSSVHHPIEAWKKDLVEDARTGRLLYRDPGGSVSVALDGLSFANGVALAADESFVTVAQTGDRSLLRLWLSGARTGTVDVFRGDLPGYPDNISTGSDGLIWVTIASPTDPVVELVRRLPLRLRRVVANLPEALQPAPKRTVRVMALDQAGAVVHDIAVETTRFHMVTGVREHQGRVWLGSLHEAAIAAIDLPDRHG